jgi:HEAT repeat protein
MGMPDVLRLLRDDDQLDKARQGAAISCGALVRRSEEGVIDLVARKGARDKDIGVRQLLLIALGQIGGERAATHLAGTLATGDHRVRAYTMLALGLTGSESAGSLLAAEFVDLKNSSDRAACAIGIALAGHRAAAPALRQEAERGHPAFLGHALLALALLGDREALPLVRRTLDRNNDPAIRSEACVALALLQGASAVPELLQLLDDTKSDLGRASIAGAIGLVGTEAAVEPLLDIYRDKKRQPEERALAIAALGRIADGDPYPVLDRYAFDLHPYASAEAITELVSIL